MTIKTEFNPDLHVLACPFSTSCVLPKKTSICKFPSYKQCSEYQAKVKKLKSNLIL